MRKPQKSTRRPNPRTHSPDGYSKQWILSDENQSDFDQLYARWHTENAPTHPTAVLLLEEVILRHWLMLRAQRRYMIFDESLAGTDPIEWTEQQYKMLERMTRYRTNAEQAFYRALRALRQVARPKSERQTPAQPKSVQEQDALHQWVEVETNEEQTTTTLNPPNEELLAKPSASSVIRHIHFLGRIPSEYAWTQSSEDQPVYGGKVTQRMPYQVWLNVLAKEKLRPGGHLGPS